MHHHHHQEGRSQCCHHHHTIVVVVAPQSRGRRKGKMSYRHPAAVQQPVRLIMHLPGGEYGGKLLRVVPGAGSWGKALGPRKRQ